MPKRSVIKTKKYSNPKKEKCKILGLNINENLSLKPHMTNILCKVRSGLCIVKKIKPYLNKESLLTLNHSLILSHILYCITLWYNGNKSVVGQLQRSVNII